MAGLLCHQSSLCVTIEIHPTTHAAVPVQPEILRCKSIIRGEGPIGFIQRHFPTLACAKTSIRCRVTRIRSCSFRVLSAWLAWASVTRSTAALIRSIMFHEMIQREGIYLVLPDWILIPETAVRFTSSPRPSDQNAAPPSHTRDLVPPSHPQPSTMAPLPSFLG